jgi:hypothetical protein
MSSFVFYFVGKDAAIQKKLIQEIDQAWETHGSSLDGGKLG